MLAYISRDHVHFISSDLLSVPDSLKDDTEVMTILCNKCFSHCKLASPRLRADRDFVLTCMGDGSCYQHFYLDYVSVELRSSKSFMLELLDRANLQETQLRFLFEYSELSIQDEKELALLAVLKGVKRSKDKDVEFLGEVLHAVCDDKDVMMQFVTFHWRALILFGQAQV